MRVKSRMTPDPITASPKTTHREAMELMKKHDISHLPVIDAGGNVVGIVSEVDLLSTGPSRVTTLSIYELYTLLDELTLDQIMSKPVLAVPQDCSLPNAASHMLENGVSCLLVLDGDKLVGIITETDIFKTFVEVLGGGQPGARVDVQLDDKQGMLAQAAMAFAEAGSYIYSLTTFQDESGAYTFATIKEEGATEEGLRAAVDKREGVKLLEFRPNEEDCLEMLGG